MKFLLSTLKSFLPTSLSPSEIGEKLTMLGFEVESITPYGLSFSNVIVGQVVESRKHPDAEKLTIAQVSNGARTFEVVCAAPNCRTGITVAYAQVGAQIGDLKIEARKLRGVLSHGMLCGHDELDLPKEPFGVAGGIMELDESFTVGRHLGCYFGDLLFEVALTPNLAYAAHVRGIATELGAFLKEKVLKPTFHVQEKGKKKLQVTAQCPRYACRIIEGVKTAESPEWLRQRVEGAGMRSVNNIVDATNWVMLEMGQPLHAFDLAMIEGKLCVRPAKKGETLTTLDGKERVLAEEIDVVADEKKAVAIAGIMGSAESEVTGTTSAILLEAAYFDPQKVRKAAKRLEMSTDASYRFERGTDPNCLEEALDQASALIIEVAGGEAAPLVIAGAPFPPKKIALRPSRVNAILGTQLALSEIETLLRSLHFKVQQGQEDSLTVSCPPARHDLKSEIDLIEEVARFYGYANIEKKAPPHFRTGALDHHPTYLFEKQVRSLLLEEGLQELLTCDLISPKEAKMLANTTSSPIHLTNPSSHEQSILRTSLLPSLLRVVQHNRDHGIETVCGFEIGKLHLKVKESYLEPTVASLVLSGHSPLHWSEKERAFDFYDLKGIIENFLRKLDIAHRFESSHHPRFHPGRQASLIIENNEVGILGQVHPTLAENVYFAEIHLEDLLKALPPKQQMRPLPHFPPSARDLTLPLPSNLHVQRIFDRVQGTPLLEEISLIDVYQDEKLGSDVKNVTFRFLYRDSKRTLSIEEVEKVHAEVTEMITQELKPG